MFEKLFQIIVSVSDLVSKSHVALTLARLRLAIVNATSDLETTSKTLISSVAMTTVTFENCRKFTFNPIYFTSEFGDPFFCVSFLHLNISFSLSNEYTD